LDSPKTKEELSSLCNKSVRQIAELIRAVQNQAAGILIARNLLTAEILKNPQPLPADLQAQVEQSKVAIAPKPQNPLVVASQWITKAKSYQKNQGQLAA
jgi:hypothetical protein